MESNDQKTPPDIAHAIATAPFPVVRIVCGHAWGGHAVYKTALTRHEVGDWNSDGFYNYEEE